MRIPKVLMQISKRLYSQDLPKLTNVVSNEGVKTITMSHPKTGNCLSISMMKNLIKHIASDAEDKNTRVVVIAAEGKVFSSGHDLNELSTEAGRKKQEEVFLVASKLMQTIIECPVPVIAAIDGYAVAAGCQLVAQCDLAVCTERSKFSTPGANVGIFCSTPGVALARSVPKAVALKMLLTGQPISAADAFNAGLVSHICTSEDFKSLLSEVCAEITSKSRAVIEIGKCFYYKQINEDMLTAYHQAGRVMVENLNMADGIEGVKSFTSKRKPIWKHE